MRCTECNVDLGEEYTKCPLCGADAVDEEPHLKGIKTAQYPKYDPSLLTEKNKYHPTFPQKYVFRVCTAFSVILVIIAIVLSPFFSDKIGVFSFKNVMQCAVPALMGISSLFYFFYSFKEKGRLLHSILSLLATEIVLLIFTVVAVISHSGTVEMIIVLAVCTILFVIVFASKPTRVKEQLKATFKL